MRKWLCYNLKLLHMQLTQRAFCILLMFYCSVATAQNLVPNPGFEDYNNCPTDRSEIVYSPGYDSFPTAKYWVSPLSATTPDYYNTCATNPLVSVPYNTYNGYRQPHSGNAYAGISMFSGFPAHTEINDYREYLQTKLAQPLMAGHSYLVSFFVNLTYHLPELYNVISVDRVGAYLSIQKIDSDISFLNKALYLDVQAQVESQPGAFITDTSKWVKIRGIYTAQGGEEWLTLGRFKDSHSILGYKLLYSPVSSIDSLHSACYMYVDDVCVLDLENITTSDTTIHSTSFPMVLEGSNTEGEYLWNTGGKEQTQLIASPGTYWRATTGNCSYRVDSIHVVKSDTRECLWLPTAFTPNGDGKNDQYGPEHYCYTPFFYYDFSIYNRWGERIYQTDNPDRKWDGRWRGVQQDAGTYFYQLSYTYTAQPGYVSVNSQKSNLKVIKGDFELLR